MLVKCTPLCFSNIFILFERFLTIIHDFNLNQMAQNIINPILTGLAKNVIQNWIGECLNMTQIKNGIWCGNVARIALISHHLEMHNIAATCNRFNQHIMSSFFKDFLLPKKKCKHKLLLQAAIAIHGLDVFGFAICGL